MAPALNMRSASAEVTPARLQACSKAGPRLRIDETGLDKFNNAVWVSNGKVYLLLVAGQHRASLEVWQIVGERGIWFQPDPTTRRFIYLCNIVGETFIQIFWIYKIFWADVETESDSLVRWLKQILILSEANAIFTIEINDFNCTIWRYFQTFDWARTGRSKKLNCNFFSDVPNRCISWRAVRRVSCYIRHKRSF